MRTSSRTTASGEMLRVTFNSDFFKDAAVRNARIKSPVEVVAGSLRLSGGYEWPTQDVYDANASCGFMGQSLLAPPSVEGWQGGEDWVSTGSMMQRVNYASKVIGDTARPGIQKIVGRLSPLVAEGNALRLLDGCLEHLGYLEIDDGTRREFVDFANQQIEEVSRLSGSDKTRAIEQTVISVLQLAVSTREFQLA